MTKLIFGCGYLGHRVAVRWQATSETVFVVTRSAARGEALKAEGLEPIVADILRPETLTALPTADTVLFAVGFDRTSGRSIHEVYVDGLANVLAALPAETGRLIYISSTGVYGRTGGESVDETSPCHPTRDGGRACLAAEQLLSAQPLGSRGVILRMAGLYGPGRVPSRDLLLERKPFLVSRDSQLNLIHIDDAAGIVLAAERRAAVPRLYVVSDGHPVERQEYYGELARLLDAPPPVFAQRPAGDSASDRSGGNKRIDNRRMLAELDVQLTYLSYREGLRAIVAVDRG